MQSKRLFHAGDFVLRQSPESAELTAARLQVREKTGILLSVVVGRVGAVGDRDHEREIQTLFAWR